MKNKDAKIGKKFGNSILERLIEIENVISATIVGSFSENYDLSKIGDLDIVIICKKFEKKIVVNAKKQIKFLKVKKKKIKINTSFGPIKFNPKKYLTIHLMIYDIKSHIDHTLKSPFTCYDWERSNWYKGEKLSNIFPVLSLQLRDFFEARRNATEYLEDLKKNRISYRDYAFKNSDIYLKKKYFKINNQNRGEFVYHIIKNLILNYFKFFKNKNIKPKKEEAKKVFLNITQNDKILWNKFLVLKFQKENLIHNYSTSVFFLANSFLKYYNRFLITEKKSYQNLMFIRHHKTRLNKNNIFLGQNQNPEILDKKKRKETFDLAFTSVLKRAISTAKLYNCNKILKDKILNEINYGKAEGMSFRDFKKKYSRILMMWKTKKDFRFPSGENHKDVEKRVLMFLEKIKKFNQKRMLIVTHNVFLRCLLGHFLNIKKENYFKIKIKHMEKLHFVKKGKNITSNLKRSQISKILKGCHA